MNGGRGSQPTTAPRDAKSRSRTPTARREGDRHQVKGAPVRRRPADAMAREGRSKVGRVSGPTREQRQTRHGPATTPIPRPARPKSTSQAKARAKARKAKAPKVVRPPLRARLLTRLSAIDLNPKNHLSRVPFVVLVIAALGLGLGMTLWLSTDAAERSYQLGSARQLNEALQQQKEALERQVLEAQAAPALAESARNLGMIPSRDTAHLVKDPAGNWIVVGTPKPAEGVPPAPLNVTLPDEAPPPAPRPAPPTPLRAPERAPEVGRAPVAPGQPLPPTTRATDPEVVVRAPVAAPLDHSATGPVQVPPVTPGTGPAPGPVPAPAPVGGLALIPAPVPASGPAPGPVSAPAPVSGPAPGPIPGPAPVPAPTVAPLGVAVPVVPPEATAELPAANVLPASPVVAGSPA